MMRVQQATPIVRGPETLHDSPANDAANDERRLVAEAKSGSSSAFGELYQRHRLKIYHIALRILRNQQDAEDAAQRCFQRAFTNLARFRGDSKFSTWVNRIAINEALMMLRGRRTNTALFEGDSDNGHESFAFDLADKGPTPEETLADNELRGVVLHAVSQLRESLRTVVLRQLQGLTSAQTARHLGLSVAAVKARTFHARRHLRRQLEGRLQAARNGFLIEKEKQRLARH